MINGHYILQGIFEPPKRIYFMFFADGEKGIDHTGSGSSIVSSGKEIVFAAQCDRANGIFYGIIINMQVSIQ